MEKKKVKSDGGSTEYYKLPKWATELRHLMEYKQMTPDQANIFKASFRLDEKDGNSVLYDLNKIRFFADCIEERIIREQKDEDEKQSFISSEITFCKNYNVGLHHVNWPDSVGSNNG